MSARSRPKRGRILAIIAAAVLASGDQAVARVASIGPNPVTVEAGSFAFVTVRVEPQPRDDVVYRTCTAVHASPGPRLSWQYDYDPGQDRCGTSTYTFRIRITAPPNAAAGTYTWSLREYYDGGADIEIRAFDVRVTATDPAPTTQPPVTTAPTSKPNATAKPKTTAKPRGSGATASPEPSASVGASPSATPPPPDVSTPEVILTPVPFSTPEPVRESWGDYLLSGWRLGILSIGALGAGIGSAWVLVRRR